ncbi:hypothetical protein RDI58_002974 [Solanum bulbocastanum]|uniref:Uncharacterized protein n=1 Tax=Solanum bulbocastanum TaxID=147425 RepID=A0AAN8U7I5_SOLBU
MNHWCSCVQQNSEKFAIKKKTSLGFILLGDPTRKFITETNSCFRCLAFPEKLHTTVILSAVSGVFAHARFTGAPSGTTIARSYRKNAGAKELRRFAVKTLVDTLTDINLRGILFFVALINIMLGAAVWKKSPLQNILFGLSIMIDVGIMTCY